MTVQVASVSRRLAGREAEGQPAKHVVGRRTTILTQDRPVRKGSRPPGPTSPLNQYLVYTLPQLSNVKGLAYVRSLCLL